MVGFLSTFRRALYTKILFRYIEDWFIREHDIRIFNCGFFAKYTYETSFEFIQNCILRLLSNIPPSQGRRPRHGRPLRYLPPLRGRPLPLLRPPQDRRGEGGEGARLRGEEEARAGHRHGGGDGLSGVGGGGEKRWVFCCKLLEVVSIFVRIY